MTGFRANHFKRALVTSLVLGALVLIGIVGHRHWFTSDPATVWNPPLPEWTAPAKPVKVKKPTKPRKDRPAPKTAPVPPQSPIVPVPPQWRRSCDASGWCWTYFG